VKALEPEVRALETWLGYGLDFPCFTGEPAAVAQASEA
jgi:hypothetical protein